MVQMRIAAEGFDQCVFDSLDFGSLHGRAIFKAGGQVDLVFLHGGMLMRSANTSFVDDSLLSSFPGLPLRRIPTNRFRRFCRMNGNTKSAALLPKAAAKRLIKLCQSASAPRVSFEANEREAA
jgi:hypothetical protein